MSAEESKIVSKNYRVKVQAGYRITIPKEIREKHGFTAGTKVRFSSAIYGDEYVIVIEKVKPEFKDGTNLVAESSSYRKNKGLRQ